MTTFTKIKQPFALMEFPVPETEPKTTIMRITLTNVCNSDLHIWQSTYDVSQNNSEPFCLSIGHKMTDMVHELNDGFTTDSTNKPLTVNNRVVFQYFVGCNKYHSYQHDTTPRCPKKLKYHYPPNQYPHFTATYNQYYYLRPKQTIFKMPDNVPDELTGPTNCALTQIIDKLEHNKTGPENHLIIQKTDKLKLNTIAIAHEQKIGQMIVIDNIPNHLKLALTFGTDHVINLNEFPSTKNRIRRVFELTEENKTDLIMELVKSAQILPETIEMLTQDKTLLKIGNINQKQTITLDPSQLIHGNKTIIGIMSTGPRQPIPIPQITIRSRPASASA